MPSDLGTSSRPSSPAQLDELANKKDKTYRRYATTVEKALALFDTALQEWADYISFLSRFLKALQTRPSSITDVPHTELVAKRLAQCLDPRLPSGVHQKALDVYAYVFSVLQGDGLSRDLSLYLPGLAPLLSYASLSVRPALLSLFEANILKLNASALRPASKSIILALLPGLEDETSEEFERVHFLLNKLRKAIGRVEEGLASENVVDTDKEFWQSLFLSTITSASRRPGSLQYLFRNLPYLGPSSGQLPQSEADVTDLLSQIDSVTLPEPGLLIRCLAAGLKDDQILVQRGFLEILVTKIPLSSEVLQQRIKPEDLELLISAAVSVVARREMSLNRRLWAWFLGPQSSKEASEQVQSPTAYENDSQRGPLGRQKKGPSQIYFEQFGLNPLTRCIRKMISASLLSPTGRARPFRICLSLMDRSEIGGLVVPQVFLQILENVKDYELAAPNSESFSEVLRSAHVFFDGVQSRLIWAELCRLIFTAFNSTPGEVASARNQRRFSQLEPVWFVITKFNVKEEEMLVLHLPRACLLVLDGIERLASEDAFDGQARREFTRLALRIAARLLDLIPERAFDEDTSATMENATTLRKVSKIDPTEVLRSYNGDSTENGGSHQATLKTILPRLLLDYSAGLVNQAIQGKRADLELENTLTVLVKTERKVPNGFNIDSRTLLNSLQQACVSITDDSHARRSSQIAIMTNAVSLLDFLSTVESADDWVTDSRVRQIASSLVAGLWTFLQPDRPQYSTEATRCLWRINAVSPHAQLVESSICSLMVTTGQESCAGTVTLGGARCFTTLWTQTISKISSSDRRSSLGRAKRKSSRRSSADIDELDMLARPLSLLIDSLQGSSQQLRIYTTGWLQSLPSIQVIMDFLVHRLQTGQYMKEVANRKNDTLTTKTIRAQSSKYTANELLYHVQSITNIIKCCPSTAATSLNSPAILAEPAVVESVKRMAAVKIEPSQDEEEITSVWEFLMTVLLMLLEDRFLRQGSADVPMDPSGAVMDLLHQMLSHHNDNPRGLELESTFLGFLSRAIQDADLSIQGSIIECFLIVTRRRLSQEVRPSNDHRRSVSYVATPNEKMEDDSGRPESQATSPALLDCLISGLSAPSNWPIVDQWVRFLGDCLPLFDAQIFQILISVVECFQKSIDGVFEGLKSGFSDEGSATATPIEPINVLNILFNGLEQTLGQSHQKLARQEASATPVKSAEPSQGFFGNMVSGVFATEVAKSRSSTANDRLTVLICFKDSVRTAFNIWSWGITSPVRSTQSSMSAGSFNYLSVRLRNRARRILENLVLAEPLESLETIIEIWRQSGASDRSTKMPAALNLLHALDASRPKNTIPTAFNALYSRTSPASLVIQHTSTLTSELSEFDVANFLVEYTKSIEDDALDEIWVDCVSFLKNVLGNPMPQRQILPKLLEFVAVLGEKIDNTNFGEQRRMRKEIGDLFVRLLTATFTVRPLAFSYDQLSTTAGEEKAQDDGVQLDRQQGKESSEDVVAILGAILPSILALLSDTDRKIPVFTTLSTQVLGPTFRSRRYPQNVTLSTLEILKTMSKATDASKIWRKDVAEAFNDSKFFCSTSLHFAKDGWLPVFKQWALVDKDRMSELLTRLSAPTSAGILFGVGASSARLEADRKAQLNLRRVATLVMAADTDEFLVNVSGIQEKLAELSNATNTSSPSSVIRSEMYMVMRALILKISTIHLASLWPVLNGELYDSLSSLINSSSSGKQDLTPSHVAYVLQAAKLLDLLLTVAPDDFQLREWLYVTDTIDAVYRPADWRPVALVDNLADRLDTASGSTTPSHSHTSASLIQQQHGAASTAAIVADDYNDLRRPLLRWSEIQHVPKDREMVDKILRPFLRQLSIVAFESTYRMSAVDRQACEEELLRDLFDESTLV